MKLPILSACIAALILGCPRHASADTATASAVVIGNPANPADLQKQLTEAYNNGARNLTIRAGTYIMPDSDACGIVLPNWTNAVVHADGVTMIFEGPAHWPFLLKQCDHVTVEGAILRFAKPAFTQGKITALGRDAQGTTLDWRIDTGYPANVDPLKWCLDVVDHTTRLIRAGTGDFGGSTFETLAPGLFRLHGVRGALGAAEVNDWIFTRLPDLEGMVHLENCGHCVLRNLIIQNSGFGAFFETGGEGGNTYVGCRVMCGPRPEGATEDELVGCGADGFHSRGTRTGPTIDHCSWEGMLHDDCIAIHGQFTKVIGAEGNKLILENNLSRFAVGEPVRISSTKGYFGEFTCMALRPVMEKVDFLEVTLNEKNKRYETPAVTITMEKGTNVISGPNAMFVPKEPVKLSTRKGALGEFECKTVRIVTRNVDFMEVTLDRESGAPAGAKASNPKRNGDGFRILNCTLGNCRSRGILVKADNGLIEGCTISGCGMSAISIGPEYWWNESDYSRHVIVRGNKFINNGVNGYSAIIFVHGDGATGNADIAITGNLFDKSYSPTAVHVEDTDGVVIADNRFIVRPLSPTRTRGLLDFRSSRNIRLRGNFVENASKDEIRVTLGADVTGITGNDSSGIQAFTGPANDTLLPPKP